MAADHHLWREDSDWPRWLLHISSLTSYPWQPGNKYCGISNPIYNAISYTWGRFQDHSGRVSPLPINGIPWEASLPRIQPDHFSTDDLLQIVHSSKSPFADSEKVEFLWLDIACIDQTPGTKENPNVAKAKEIGRQVKIFKGAKNVFVWLTCHNTQSIMKWTRKMDESIQLRLAKEFHKSDFADVARWLDDMTDILAEFTRDRWFGSLWTLQEAFLRPDAIISLRDGISQELKEDMRDGGGDIVPWRLSDWIGAWQFVQSGLQDFDPHQYPQALKLTKAIDDIGFMESVRNQWLTYAIDDDEFPLGSLGNPFALLMASTRRNPQNKEDRVYGIMQVYDLQLGEAAPGETRTNFALDELTDQLGAALLERYPIASQLMIQHKDCPEDKAWRINWDMTLPEHAHRYWRHLAHGGDIIVDVSDAHAKMVDGVTVASITSRLTAFQHWRRVNGTVTTTVAVDKRWLDDPIGLFGRSSSQQSTLLWLECEFPDLKIALLGRTRPSREHDKTDFGRNFQSWAIGLLLRPNMDKATYKRVGTLVWSLDWKEHFCQYAHGHGSYWRTATISFG